MAEQLDRAEKSSSGFLYLLLGFSLGSLITLLLAPQSGDETRDYLARSAREVKDYTQRNADEFRDRAGTLVEQGKEAVREKTQQVSAGVDAGREAYKQELAKGKVTGK